MLNRIIGTISTILVSTITTSILFYVGWDYVFSIPLLKSIAGMASVIAIVLAEIVFIIWLFIKLAQKSQEYKKEEQQQLILPAANVRSLGQYASITSPDDITIPIDTTRKQTSLRYLPLAVLFIIIVSIAGGIFYTNQVNIPTAYLAKYGSPTLTDPLRKSGLWNEMSRATFGGNCQFLENTYHIREEQSQQTFGCSSTSTYQDIAFEVEMTILQGDCGGVRVRNDLGSGTGYTFQVCQNGTYALLRGSDQQNILSTGHNSALHQGSGNTNLLAIVVQGTLISVYINRQLIASAQDESYTKGAIALLAVSQEQATEVAYTNAKIWQL